MLRWSAHNRVFSPQQKSNASPAIFLSLQPQATVVECVLSEHFCGKVFLLYRIFINFYCLLGEIVHELAPCFISRKQAKWRKRKKKWENRVFPPLCEGRKIPFWHCSQIHFRFFFSLPFLGLKWRRGSWLKAHNIWTFAAYEPYQSTTQREKKNIQVGCVGFVKKGSEK